MQRFRFYVFHLALDGRFCDTERELATIPILSEDFAEGGFEPLTIGSMRKNLTSELS